MNNSYDELDVICLLKANLRKLHLYLIALLIVAVGLFAFIGYKTMLKPVYETSATVLFYPKNITSEDSYFANGKLSIANLNALKDAAGSYISFVNNRWLLYKVADELNLQIDNMEEFIEENISVSNINASPFVEISVSYADPEISYAINNKIIELLPTVLEDLNIETNVSVISFPVKPAIADIPSETTLAVIGVGMTIVLGFLLVLLQELFCRKFRSETDVTRELSIETLGFIPKNTIEKAAKSKAKLNSATGYIVSNLTAHKTKVCAFLSESSAAYTWEVSKVVSKMAETGYAVMIVDLLKPKVKSSYPPSNGTYTYVNLYDEALNPQPLAEKAEMFIKQNREEYDFIFIASMPADSLQVQMEYLAACDHVIVLLEHNKSPFGRGKALISKINRTAADKPVSAVLVNTQWKGLCSYFSIFLKETVGYR